MTSTRCGRSTAALMLAVCAASLACSQSSGGQPATGGPGPGGGTTGNGGGAGQGTGGTNGQGGASATGGATGAGGANRHRRCDGNGRGGLRQGRRGPHGALHLEECRHRRRRVRLGYRLQPGAERPRLRTHRRWRLLPLDRWWRAMGAAHRQLSGVPRQLPRRREHRARSRQREHRLRRGRDVPVERQRGDSSARPIKGPAGRCNTIGVPMGGNDTGRGMGERLAVDPNNGTILYFGSRGSGLYKSTSSGGSWTKVTGFPARLGLRPPAMGCRWSCSTSGAGARSGSTTIYVAAPPPPRAATSITDQQRSILDARSRGAPPGSWRITRRSAATARSGSPTATTTALQHGRGVKLPDRSGSIRRRGAGPT